jgi:hypothetical protein
MNCWSPILRTRSRSPVSGIGYPVDNAHYAIRVEAVDNAADGSLALSSAVVGDCLPVRPAPVTPSFGDVDAGNLYDQFIN